MLKWVYWIACELYLNNSYFYKCSFASHPGQNLDDVTVVFINLIGESEVTSNFLISN